MGITITAQDVTNVAPEFTCVPNSEIDTYIDLAGQIICAEKFGDKGKSALALVAAHLMKEIGIGSDPSSSNSGLVTSEKVGDLQRSYGQVAFTSASAQDQLFLTTKYGRLFLIIKKSIFFSPLVT